MLRAVWRMPAGDVLALPSTGTTAMEAGLANLLEPGDTVDRRRGRLLRRAPRRHGRAPGRARRARDGAARARRCRTRRCSTRSTPIPQAHLVAVVHAETSTGALHPLRELGEALAGYDALLMADCVTSLGGVPLDAGAWQLDYAYSCTQKCLGAPPGMAPVAISPHAWERIARRRTPVPFSLDLARAAARTGSTARSPTTTRRRSSPSTRCTRRCGACSTEGLEPRWARHAAAAAALHRGARGARARAARRAGVPARAAHRGARARRGRRHGRPHADARRARHRDRRRPRAGRAADLAHRADGPQREPARSPSAWSTRSTRCSRGRRRSRSSELA